MEPLKIEGTEDSPEVIFDHQNGIYYIKGESRPENAREFFKPVKDWLKGYMKLYFWQQHEFGEKSRQFCLEIELEYFNSTSAKHIYDLLLILAEYSEKLPIQVQWHYDRLDEDMLESGEELEDMSGISFEFVPH